MFAKQLWCGRRLRRTKEFASWRWMGQEAGDGEQKRKMKEMYENRQKPRETHTAPVDDV